MIRIAVTHFRTVFMSFLLLILIGLHSYIAIPKESAPDVPIPIIYVSVTHTGISPEDAVNLLLKPLEQEIRGIDGLDEMEGTAYEGGANLVLHFQAGFDSDAALDDVREKVDRAKPDLPDDAEEPVVREINISLFPVLGIILRGSVPEREMKRLAEDLQDDIETLSGVLEARLGGVREEELLIELDKARLESFALNPATIIQAITQNNRLVAAGSLELKQGRYAVKVPGLFKTANDLMNLPLLVDGDRTIRVKDVGRVKYTFKDPTTLTRVNGQPAMTLEVSKRIGENIIETVDATKALVEKASQTWPEGLTYTFISDESENIRNRLTDLQNNVLISVLLVMIVVLSALGGRSSLLVALTVPGSFLTGITLLFALGFTINMVVLFALILSVGLLVDGAIVVAELADTKLKAGKHRVDAFTEAGQEMAWPIIASTATTLAVFFPLLFWPGLMGEFMKFLPLTLIFTLSASLAMALIFLPTIGAIMPRPHFTKHELEDPPFYVQPYTRFLHWCLERPLSIVFAVTLLFISVCALYGAFGRGVEFFPNIEPEQAQIKVHARGDLSIYEKDAIMRDVEEALRGLEGVDVFYTTSGDASASRQGPSDVAGTLLLEYHDWNLGRPRSQQILDEAFQRLENIYGVRIEENEQQQGPRQDKPIKIAVTASHFEQLVPVVQELRKRLEAVPGTQNVDDDLPDPGIEWNMDIDRAEATRAGTNISEIGATLRLATNGAIVGTYRPATTNDEIDIVARFAQHERTLSSLDDLLITTPQGHVPLSHFATRTAQPKVTVIRRLDQNISAYVEADVKAGVLADTIIQGLRQELAQTDLPEGVKITFKGEDEDQKEASAFLTKAFIVALFLMAIILVTQFNSFYQAFIILTAVILSTTGVLLGHMITGKPFGIIMSGLGVISLAGIVVNNNIVLIDTFNVLIKSMPWRQAIVETGSRRLRPVLLTALTTIIGLLPMGLKLNIDILDRDIQYNAPSTQWWDQLSNSIMFGLAFATILTLIVTPCMLALHYRRLERKKPATKH